MTEFATDRPPDEIGEDKNRRLAQKQSNFRSGEVLGNRCVARDPHFALRARFRFEIPGQPDRRDASSYSGPERAGHCRCRPRRGDVIVATSIRIRVAAVVGALFGAISIVAGTRVLAGLDVPDYVVLPWLVRYNVAAGAFGVVVGVGLWLVRPWAMASAWALTAAHTSVLVAIAAWRATGGAVADDSLVAMALRTLVWSAVSVVARRQSTG